LTEDFDVTRVEAVNLGSAPAEPDILIVADPKEPFSETDKYLSISTSCREGR
jgi:hypothetical protein